MQANPHAKAGLKGAIYPSQGCCESPCRKRVFAMSMQETLILKGEMWCQRASESFKACFV
jgi:hypothetical protein